MRKRRLKKCVKVLLATIVILVVTSLTYLVNKDNKKIEEQCFNDYSKDYCYKLIYGN